VFWSRNSQGLQVGITGIAVQRLLLRLTCFWLCLRGILSEVVGRC